MKRFIVVAERSLGIFPRNAGPMARPINPFLIRDIFDPGLVSKVERRTWEFVDAESEMEVRRLFDQAVVHFIGMRGFQIVSITERTSGLTECNMHEDEPA